MTETQRAALDFILQQSRAARGRLSAAWEQNIAGILEVCFAFDFAPPDVMEVLDALGDVTGELSKLEKRIESLLHPPLKKAA